MTEPLRATLPLDGTWQARLDPNDVRLAEGWAAAETPFDRELPVPLPWQAADPSLRQYAGVVWYRRPFRVPEAWHGKAVAVRFGAVDYQARVWLNGQDVGGHQGGFTPFELEQNAHLDWGGENWLAVRVHDPADVSEIPHGKQGGRWYTPTSGIWQTVSLLARPRQRTHRLRCYPDAERGAVRLAADCLLAVDADYRLELEVLDADGAGVGRAVAALAHDVPSAAVELILPEPRLWTPETPHRYTVRATLRRAGGETVDVVEERFGLRTIAARGGQVLLNGRPLHIRGALDQGSWPETLYTAPSDDEIEHEIRLAKGMGLNLLRKHIKPEDPRYLEAADRLGILIWAEPANPPLFTSAANAALRRDLLEMIDL